MEQVTTQAMTRMLFYLSRHDSVENRLGGFGKFQAGRSVAYARRLLGRGHGRSSRERGDRRLQTWKMVSSGKRIAVSLPP
jgi:hypothetical protein